MKNSAIETKTGIQLMIDGKMKSISKTSSKFKTIKSLVAKKAWAEISELLNNGKKIESYSKGTIVEKEGNLYLGKDLLPRILGLKLMDMQKRRAKVDHLLKFWENLKKNPSDWSKQQLFGFLEANHFPITSDGRFLAYKKVTSSEKGLVDSHSRKFKNDIGTVVKMDRSFVDADPTQTCSHGLHVAAWEYAQDFSGDVLVEVLVNPKDVVAVPTDYNQQKMRVCEYKVFGKAKAERKNLVVKV